MFPRYHPNYPDMIGTSLAGHQHVPSFLTGVRTPARSTGPLSSSEAFQLAAPEGFSASLACLLSPYQALWTR